MSNVEQKDVIAFLKKELNRTNKKEAKEFIRQTLDYLLQKEETFQREWEELTGFADVLINEFNGKIQHLGLCAKMNKKPSPYPSLDFKIEALDPSIHYRNGFCDIMNSNNEYVLFDGRLTETRLDSFEEIKKVLKEEFDNKELYEICERIKSVVINAEE